MFKKSIGYVAEINLLGEVAGVDFRNGLYVLVDDNGEEHAVKIEDVEILEEAFVLHGLSIFNKDVLGSIEGKLYQVELHGEDVQLHLLDDNLEVVASGEVFTPTEDVVKGFEQIFDLQGNIYELIPELPQKPDFNIKIVKDFDGKHFTYFYACNNKETEEVDLIKVVFIGHQLLEEEYTRITLSYDVFQDSIEAGTLKEVSP